VANPNPSPATRFKKGQSGNPSGRSKEELKAMNKSAQIAAKLTLSALSSLQEKVQSDEVTADEVIQMLVNADAARLIKEAQDRAHGTPKQSVDVESPLGTMTPQAPHEVSGEVVSGLVKKLTE
jgi:hypothetical protein